MFYKRTSSLRLFKGSHQKGFSFLEVLGAMMILSISLVALMKNQTQSIYLSKKALYLDRGVSLAEGKMAELTHEAGLRGFSEFKESDQGNFEDDDLSTYTWRYSTQPVAAPDFAALAQGAMGGTEEESGDSDQQASAGLLAGPLKNITDIWSKSLLELRVEILWKEGNSEKTYALTTHLVDSAASSSIDGMIKGLSQAAGGQGEQE